MGNRFIFFNPREHKLESIEEYTTWDIHYIKECDIFFAYMEKTNPSGYGLCFELGLAYSLGKTIILVDEKSLEDDTFRKYFQIVYLPSTIVFDDIDNGIKFLEKFSI